MNLCTVTVTDQFNQVVTLAESFRRFYPEATITALLLDQVEDPEPKLIKGIDILGVSDLGIQRTEFEQLASMYGPGDLSQALKPKLFKRLIEAAGQDEKHVFIAPEGYVLGEFKEIEEALEDADAVFIDQWPDKIPDDGLSPDKGQYEGLGRISSSFFIAFHQGESQEFTELLDNWYQRYTDGLFADDELGKNPVANWLEDQLPELPKLKVLDLDNYCLGYWNLHQHQLSYSDGRYSVDGKSAKLAILYGYTPNEPESLSFLDNRIDFSKQSGVARLAEQYGKELTANPTVGPRTRSFRYEMLPDSQLISPWLRQIYRQAVSEESVSWSMATPEGAESFLQWLSEPAPKGQKFGVNRFLWHVYNNIEDLKSSYPDLDNDQDAEGFIGWVHVHGSDNIPVHRRLLPPKPEGLDKLALRTFEPPLSQIEGVNVAGFFSSELGLGEAARLLVDGLEAASIPVLPIRGSNVPGVRQGVSYQFLTPKDAVYPINILCINGDGIPGFAVEAGPEFFKDRYTIAVWWWEVKDVLPPFWLESFDYIDEIWVGTEFVAEALRDISPVPVTKVTLPITPVEPLHIPSRSALDMPEGFVYLFMYDYFSCGARKNPQDLVKAYKQAFPEPEEGVSLVLKCLNSRGMPAEHARLLWEIGDRKDIHIIDHYLDAEIKDALIESCDCYVSLHRSEGLGLSLAEAVYYEKPLITTGYGGVLDFIDDENGYLVDYETVQIGYEGYPYYPSAGTWVQPDVDQAAAYIREVYENQDEARERAKRAAKKIRKTHSPKRAGASMSKRLNEIVKGSSVKLESQTPVATLGEDIEGIDLPVGDLEHRHGRIKQPPMPKGRIKRIIKQGLMRVLRPYTWHQHRLNEKLVESVAALEEQLNSQSQDVTRLIQKTHSQSVGSSMYSSRSINRELSQLSARIAGVEYSGILGENSKRLFTNNHLRVWEEFYDRRDQYLELLGRSVEYDKLVAERYAEPYMYSETKPKLIDHPKVGSVMGYDTPPDSTESFDEYVQFEDAFRGDRERMLEQQEPYLKLLSDCKTVLDVGCGRGELVELLRKNGIEAEGLDQDQGMVERCRQSGLTATCADANQYLKDSPDKKFDAITAIEVVEHMPYSYLQSFIRLAYESLNDGGMLVLETVNPHSDVSLKAFWLDLTHQHPIFPEALTVMLRVTGFEESFFYYPTGSGSVRDDMFTTPAYAAVGVKKGK